MVRVIPARYRYLLRIFLFFSLNLQVEPHDRLHIGGHGRASLSSSKLQKEDAL